MNKWFNSSTYPVVFAVAFLALAGSFLLNAWETTPAINDPAEIVDSTFAEPVTVRLSAAELVRTDGDTSMLACYSCHEMGQEPELAFDEEDRLIWEEHRFDFDLRHGANHRNEYCYTCHDSQNLELLRTPDGGRLTLTQGNLLCGACHGTTYSDWEVGIHGRISGYWSDELGPKTFADCTSCHNAHSPAFPLLPPWPAPRPLRPAPMTEDSTASGDHD